ncbi:MAG TPA: hypothetical protein PKW37_06850 [Salinivirgaceae bacterium]|nr:hypothetical protein [Salinivirgaceae bacterium]
MIYKILTITIIVLLFILITIVIYFAKNGIFKRIKPTIKETGGFAITKRTFTGNQEDILTEFEKQMDILKSFDIGYAHPICSYDNIPNKENILTNAEIGFVLYKGTEENLIKLEKHIPLGTFEKKERIVVYFPFKGGLSIQIGIAKAYPAIKKYAKKHNIKTEKITELYNSINKRIEYMIDFQRLS